MLQKFYVTGRPGKPNEEEDTEPPDEAEEKMEKNLGNLKLQFTDVAKTEEDTFDAVRSFTVPVYDTYPDEEETGSRIDWGMDLASDKEPPPEENTGEATTDVVIPDRDMREGISSLLIDSCEGEEKTIGSDEKLRDDEHWGRPPEKNAGGATTTVEAEGQTREVVASFFSLTANGCDREEGNNVAAEWSSRKLGLDLMGKYLGQAQDLLFTPPPELLFIGLDKRSGDPDSV